MADSYLATWSLPEADPGFFLGGGTNPILPNFPKNCHGIKELFVHAAFKSLFVDPPLTAYQVFTLHGQQWVKFNSKEAG